MGRQDVLSQDEETPAITCCQEDQCWGEVGGQGEEDANGRGKYMGLTEEAGTPWKPAEATDRRVDSPSACALICCSLYSSGHQYHTPHHPGLVKGPPLSLQELQLWGPFLSNTRESRVKLLFHGLSAFSCGLPLYIQPSTCNGISTVC